MGEAFGCPLASGAEQPHVVARRRGFHHRARQIVIDRQIEARGPPLDPAWQEMLDGIEPDRATIDAVTYGGGNILDADRLHQPQNLHELALAFSAHERHANTSRWPSSVGTEWSSPR